MLWGYFSSSRHSKQTSWKFHIAFTIATKTGQAFLCLLESGTDVEQRFNILWVSTNILVVWMTPEVMMQCVWWVELATKCSYCSLSIFKFFHSWNKAVWEMVNTINYHNELPLQHTLPCIPTQPWQRDWGTIVTSLLQYWCNPSGPSGSWRQAFQRRAKHVYHYTSPMLILLAQGNVRMMGPVIFTMWFKSQR